MVLSKSLHTFSLYVSLSCYFFSYFLSPPLSLSPSLFQFSSLFLCGCASLHAGLVTCVKPYPLKRSAPSKMKIHVTVTIDLNTLLFCFGFSMCMCMCVCMHACLYMFNKLCLYVHDVEKNLIHVHAWKHAPQEDFFIGHCHIA